MKTFVKPFETEESGEFLMTAWNYLALIGAAETLELRVREMHDHLIANKTMPWRFPRSGNRTSKLYIEGWRRRY